MSAPSHSSEVCHTGQTQCGKAHTGSQSPHRIPAWTKCFQHRKAHTGQTIRTSQSSPRAKRFPHCSCRDSHQRCRHRQVHDSQNDSSVTNPSMDEMLPASHSPHRPNDTNITKPAKGKTIPTSQLPRKSPTMPTSPSPRQPRRFKHRKSRRRRNDSSIAKPTQAKRFAHHEARQGPNDSHVAIAATVTQDAAIAKSTTAKTFKTIQASQIPARAK